MKKPRRIQYDYNGILLLDKPQDVSSNHALQTVKRLFKAKKAGHGGSLDPLATGLLTICFGEATKFAQFLLDADKHYIVHAQLGVVTNTSDACGEVVATKPVPELSAEKIQEYLNDFIGHTQQVPSMFSALKHNGQPLYKYARQGIEIERPARDIFLQTCKLHDYDQDTHTAKIEIKCSKGTYVRTIVADLGEKIGCGAHVTQLRRIGAGPFEIEQAMNIEQIEQLTAKYSFTELQKLLLPVDYTVAEWPEVSLSNSAEFFARNGQTISVIDAPNAGWVRLMAQGSSQFIGVGEVIAQGRVAPRRLIKSN